MKKLLSGLSQYWIFIIPLILFIISYICVGLIGGVAAYIGYGLLGFMVLGTIILTIVGFINEISTVGKNAKEYLIRKGWHRVLHLPRFFFLSKNRTLTVSKTFNFNTSCMYYFDDDSDFAKNKLFGINVGLTIEPHTNSFRFGWNCEELNGQIQIYKYEYINGERSNSKICDVWLNRDYTYEIEKTDKRINYTVYDDNLNAIATSETVFTMQIPFTMGYMCFPYFGGEEPAPHNMKIYG